MIHYHGSPIWGGKEIVKALYQNSAALVSFYRPDQINQISKICAKLVIDNGAFSHWKRAKKRNISVDWFEYWTKYYLFIMKWYSKIEWFIIPDVIEGSEEQNDELIARVPTMFKDKAVPVWHTTESIERFVRLCEQFDRVAIGACGEHKTIRSKACQARLTEAFDAIYVHRNLKTKIHGLRMLDGRVVAKFPLDSGDSTKVAINVPKTDKVHPELKGKLVRTAVFKATIEMVQSPSIDEWVATRTHGQYSFNFEDVA